MLKSSLFFIFFSLSSYQTIAACNFTINNINNVSFTYSGSTQTITGTVQIKRSQTNNGCRKFTVTVTRGNSIDYNRIMLKSPGQTYSYNLFTNTNLNRVLKDFPGANNNETIRDEFPKHSSSIYTNVNFYAHRVAPPSGTLRPGGFYLDQVTAKVFKRNNNSIHDTRNFTCSMYIPKEVQISLVATGGSFNPNDTSENLDFGELQTGESQGFDLISVSNAGYSISFSSQNNGKLKRSGGTQTIDYNLKVNGITKNLSSSSTSPVVVATGSGVTTTSGDPKNILVTIGNVSNKVAGTYNDYITITATTTE